MRQLLALSRSVSRCTIRFVSNSDSKTETVHRKVQGGHLGRNTYAGWENGHMLPGQRLPATCMSCLHSVHNLLPAMAFRGLESQLYVVTLVVTLVLLWSPSVRAANVHLYVSPTGSDSNDG
ncbi:hypothetical protein BaRGS_00025308 [Batillaria attramentaria]|uniref:Uncharacterized protein n=1 Tax=Batillaria attramentaria TaxID=370345 RepID=A0ABD0K8H3_9CAEN